MTMENTEGYSQAQLDGLNTEFERRFEAGDWPTEDRAEAEQWFADEVSHRTPDISTAAAALGRKGGKMKTAAKSEAARENGRKGGRPRVWSFRDPFAGWLSEKGKSLADAISRAYEDVPETERPEYVWYENEKIPVPGGCCRPI